MVRTPGQALLMEENDYGVTIRLSEALIRNDHNGVAETRQVVVIC